MCLECPEGVRLTAHSSVRARSGCTCQALTALCLWFPVQDLKGLGYEKGKPVGLVGVTELSDAQKKQLKEQQEVRLTVGTRGQVWSVPKECHPLPSGAVVTGVHVLAKLLHSGGTHGQWGGCQAGMSPCPSRWHATPPAFEWPLRLPGRLLTLEAAPVVCDPWPQLCGCFSLRSRAGPYGIVSIDVLCPQSSCV